MDIHENPKKSIGSGRKSVRKPLELDANPKKSIGSGHRSKRNQLELHANPNKSTEFHRKSKEIQRDWREIYENQQKSFGIVEKIEGTGWEIYKTIEIETESK